MVQPKQQRSSSLNIKAKRSSLHKPEQTTLPGQLKKTKSMKALKEELLRPEQIASKSSASASKASNSAESKERNLHPPPNDKSDGKSSEISARSNGQNERGKSKSLLKREFYKSQISDERLVRRMT